jgi:hypothetical protein
MVPKNVLIAGLATALLAWSGVSMADEYRPDEFLTLDLAKAVLSPKRLAPASDFEAAAVEPRPDTGSESARAPVAPQAQPDEPKAHPDGVVPKTDVVKTDTVKTHIVKTRVAHMRTAKPRDVAEVTPEKPRGAVRTELAHVRTAQPRGAARTRLAHRHGNPLDAEARDTRIQVWPCKSGGICDWQRAKN